MTSPGAATPGNNDTSEPRREALGRRVREVWVAWAQQQPDAKPHWLTGWDELDAGQREVDMRIGGALWGDGFQDGLDSMEYARTTGQRLRALPAPDAAPSVSQDPGTADEALRERLADAVASLLARQRFGPGVSMDGRHNPNAAELHKARTLVRDSWPLVVSYGDQRAEQALRDAAETARDNDASDVGFWLDGYVEAITHDCPDCPRADEVRGSRP